MLANNRFFGVTAATRLSGLAPAENGLLAHQMLARQAGGFGKTVALPRGYGSIGLAWPARAGEIGADLDATLTLTASGALLATRAAAGSANLSLTATGQLAAVAAVAGSATVTMTAAGTLSGLAVAAGAANIALTGSATLGAIAAVAGQANIVLGATSTMGARATVAGTAYFSAAAEGSQLTEASIASAVWAASASANSAASSMGEKLNAAAASGLSPSEAAMIARIEKWLRNKRITNPATGVQTVYDDDGTTPLGQGAMFEDAAGAQPYRGQGAERAERLA